MTTTRDDPRRHLGTTIGCGDSRSRSRKGTTMRVMSSQDMSIMRALKQGPMTLAQLQATLPSSDGRTRLVQRASLSRSLRRLVGRGTVVVAGHTYSVLSVAANVPAAPNSSSSSLVEMARQRLQRFGVR